MSVMSALFGGGRNVIAETAGILLPNAEASAERAAEARAAALAQYAAEFHARAGRTWADVLADAVNRLVRPMLTLAIFSPIGLTIADPEGMARVWRALATLPPGYWAVAGIVLPFYFGGRMQVKSLEAGQFLAAAAAVAGLKGEEHPADGNAALDDWRRTQD